ncbi:hydrogenase iron-sulfur subunit [Candidatus Latescibacterota bacterium]
MNKEPIIIAFCCHYCAFTAADLAGTMRQQYPTNVRIVRLPCTGKVDIGMLLHAFCSGADGVMVAGCEEGSCHFMTGNIRAKKRVMKAKQLIEETGVNPERLEMFHIAASQGPLFALTASEFTEKIKGLDMEITGNEKDDISNRENIDENCKPMEKISDSS